MWRVSVGMYTLLAAGFIQTKPVWRIHHHRQRAHSFCIIIKLAVLAKGDSNGTGTNTNAKPGSVVSAIKEQLSGIQFDNAALASYARRLGSLLFYVVHRK